MQRCAETTALNSPTGHNALGELNKALPRLYSSLFESPLSYRGKGSEGKKDGEEGKREDGRGREENMGRVLLTNFWALWLEMGAEIFTFESFINFMIFLNISRPRF